MSTAATGWLVTVTQLGYALGILLVVPLGDVLDRRKLVPAVLGAAAIALTASALAPNFGLLLAANALVGLTTVSSQLLTPLAGDLADDATRGRVIGTVAPGVIAQSAILEGVIYAGTAIVFGALTLTITVITVATGARIDALGLFARIPWIILGTLALATLATTCLALAVQSALASRTVAVRVLRT